MPLHSKISNNSAVELFIWSVKEDYDYFASKLVITEKEQSIIDQLAARKQIEWLSSRYLLHLMSGRAIRGSFIKDIHGKPALENSSHHISISHSNGFIAVIACEKIVGIDIQTPVEKISRIQHKFVSEKEKAYIPEDRALEALHILWGAKESLYKAYGKREIDYKKHLAVHDAARILVRPGAGTLQKNNFKIEYEIRAELVLDYILTYCFEI